MLDREINKDQMACVRVGNTPDALSDIKRPDCAAAVWGRQLTPAFLSWMDALAPEQLPRARIILRPDAVENAVVQLCEIAGTPDCLERDQLINDVSQLAETFAAIQAQNGCVCGWMS